ncbi:MAG: YegS/Rv2252/BmrU family lipid kinase [Defluviitaleaceae bacterium]|nr:YegS/Rv2252/BmrU family lipid kinase [Defluviitaleaceae bacterium]MCL2224913.1 YegS/Rv2252/BmrU family lipid kinase [Defluviitaleaceae bacterium]MCL2262525.1 YegS/Rv2252/BmrU family lipid kinase [Defluviitaleaceae bacterium]
MKKLRLIYNPFSGDRRFKDALDSCAEIFFDAGYLTNTIRVTTEETMETAIAELTNEDALVISGGDGTVNMAINAMKRNGKTTPLGIIPAGTANDFASFLEIPKEPRQAAEAIANGYVISADLGCANGQYFNNVCGGGLFINVSHSLTGDNLAKSIFGKLAYYIKGLGQLPNITPLPLRITTDSATYEEDFALFLVLNSGGCGGFNKISPNASINDGYLDFVAFRAMAMKDIAGLFLKILAGEHLEDHRVLFSHETSVSIEYLGTDPISTDVDGEPGPEMPLKITCEKGGLNLLVPKGFK